MTVKDEILRPERNEMIRRLAKSVREFKKPAILTLIFIVLEAIIETFIPFVTAMMVEKIEAGVDIGEIIKIGLLLVLMAVLSLACGGAAGYTCAKASAGFSRNLRYDLFSKIQTFSFKNIDKFSTSSLITRLTTDVGQVQMAFMMIIRIAVRAPLMLIFSIIMTFVMGGELAWAFIAITIPLSIGLVLIARFALPTFRAVFKKYDKMNESIEENVRGMRVVKGFSREEYEKQKFGAASDAIRRDFTKAERIVAWNSPLMQFCVYANMIVVMLIGSRLVITSGGTAMNVETMSALLTYGMQILMQFMMLSMIFVIMTISAESARRINEVLSEEPTLKNPENPVMTVADGSIDFENVGFKYSENAEAYALSDVNLHIGSGMTVGILGGTGSSKSTLVQLIPRLYDTSTGTVKVGGVDVRDYDMEVLRSSVAMVLQKNVIFSGTIKENLLWGNPNATDEEIVAACKLAQADEFITSFPNGYDSVIEQGGTNVSGGQKQRLCIARALIKKPKIIILDDSTSAVDTKTDALIREGFKSYIPETTKIIIAQRVASVMESDMILVMDGGKIVASGTHDELMNTCDIYKEVYEQQTNGGDFDD